MRFVFLYLCRKKGNGERDRKRIGNLPAYYNFIVHKMLIKELNIINFKNIAEVNLVFCPGFNCFVGNNGAGKTNILDAIYQLSMCKSYFNLSDTYNIRHDEPFFMIQGKYRRKDEDLDISCGVKRGQKKVFKKNQKVYERLSDHIGLLPLVMISPEDVSLIDGGSEERRKLIDGIISQSDRQYLYLLIRFNKALAQRNVLLKQYQGRPMEPEILDVWDDQLVEYGEVIRQKREAFLADFKDVFQHYYEQISSGKEVVSLDYRSSSSGQSLQGALQAALLKDRALGYTSVGIHRDDLNLVIGGYPVKKTASQGQKKTYLIALKFAQYAWLYKLSGVKPLLLLDDIFDKLDADRVNRIVEITGEDIFGQIFITDTNRQHMDRILENRKTNYALFKVSDGEVVGA